MGAVFDLQQVISTYFERESNFNLTLHDIATKECLCFAWNEADSKRGSAEITTCVFKATSANISKGIKTVYLYSDGCYVQNRNYIVASLLLYRLGKFTSIEKNLP